MAAKKPASTPRVIKPAVRRKTGAGATHPDRNGFSDPAVTLTPGSRGAEERDIRLSSALKQLDELQGITTHIGETMGKVDGKLSMGHASLGGDESALSAIHDRLGNLLAHLTWIRDRIDGIL